MLIEVLHPIQVDGKALCESFRLNLIPEERKLRMKIQFSEESVVGKKLVDLVVYHYSEPKLDGFGFSISFRGKEMETGLDFSASIAFKLSKRVWKVKGNIGTRSFNMECPEAIRLIEQIGQIVYPIAVFPSPVTQLPQHLYK